jgi:hypothetical protein
VSVGDPLFTILDPRRLWIGFNVPASHASRLENTSGATFSPEGSNQVFRTDRLLTVGSALDPERRTLAVTFEVRNP